MYKTLKSITTDLFLKALRYKFENSTNKLFYFDSPKNSINIAIGTTHAIIKIRKGESINDKKLVLTGKKDLIKTLENARGLI